VPEATTLKVAVAPTVTLWFCGWVVIVGATVKAVTVSVAALLVWLPATLLTVTVKLFVVIADHCRRRRIASTGRASDRGAVLKPLVASGAVPEATTEKVAVAAHGHTLVLRLRRDNRTSRRDRQGRGIAGLAAGQIADRGP